MALQFLCPFTRSIMFLVSVKHSVICCCFCWIFFKHLLFNKTGDIHNYIQGTTAPVSTVSSKKKLATLNLSSKIHCSLKVLTERKLHIQYSTTVHTKWYWKVICSHITIDLQLVQKKYITKIQFHLCMNPYTWIW